MNSVLSELQRNGMEELCALCKGLSEAVISGNHTSSSSLCWALMSQQRLQLPGHAHTAAPQQQGSVGNGVIGGAPLKYFSHHHPHGSWRHASGLKRQDVALRPKGRECERARPDCSLYGNLLAFCCVWEPFNGLSAQRAHNSGSG